MVLIYNIENKRFFIPQIQKPVVFYQVWWLMTVVPVLGRLR
jgi:hypothetical protein